jgi:hypothetical protein
VTMASYNVGSVSNNVGLVLKVVRSILIVWCYDVN